MANATAKAQSQTVPWGEDKIKRNLAATAATYYPGTMIALNSSGNAVKCDDTASIKFDGLMADSFRITVDSGDSAGDKKVTVERPFRFTMKIASASAGDEGRAVYALYDNEVAYSGVSNSIQVGWVDRVIDSTTVQIIPVWLGIVGFGTVSGNAITFTGSTGANTISMPDNLADALSIKQGANSYLTFITTDSGERVQLKKQTLLGDSIKLAFGDADDITMAWDGTDFDVLQATANSSIKWGVDGAGIDHVFYGDTASTNMTWDQSADSLIFNGAARIVWTGTTGQPEMHLTDNLADALSIEISGSTDLMVFTTTDNAESVAVRGLRTTSTTAVAITGATTLTLADSGGIFTVSQGAAYDVDLPSPTSGPGCSYFFSLTGAAANNVTITVAGGAATFVGSITIDGATIVATGSTLTFASGASSLGDSIEVRSIATNLYHVRAFASGAGGITIA